MRNKFTIKKLDDGRALLNLGCGTTMDHKWNNIDFSPYAFLVRHKALAFFTRKLGLLSDQRFERLSGLDPNIIRWDLKRGIPFANDQFDAIYTSNLLEHFDLQNAISLLEECHRVLRKDGILRIVVPDLETLVRNYVDTLNNAKKDSKKINIHLRAIDNIFEQIIRVEPYGTSRQQRFVRFIENLLRRNAQSSGEAHRWMYDSVSLINYLNKVGFKKIVVCNYRTSNINDFNSYKFDLKLSHSERDLSLFIEGIKNE